MEWAYDGEGRQVRRTDKANGAMARETIDAYNPDGSLASSETTDH